MFQFMYGLEGSGGEHLYRQRRKLKYLGEQEYIIDPDEYDVPERRARDQFLQAEEEEPEVIQGPSPEKSDMFQGSNESLQKEEGQIISTKSFNGSQMLEKENEAMQRLR